MSNRIRAFAAAAVAHAGGHEEANGIRGLWLAAQGVHDALVIIDRRIAARRSGSAHPWYSSSLPFRPKNGFRFASVALMVSLSILSASATSLSKLSVFQSQLGSLNTTYEMIGCRGERLRTGQRGPTQFGARLQSRINLFPVREFRDGERIFFTVSICGAVKQSELSRALAGDHLGSKWQRVGSLISPSFRPSAASQAFSTA